MFHWVYIKAVNFATKLKWVETYNIGLANCNVSQLVCDIIEAEYVMTSIHNE